MFRQGSFNIDPNTTPEELRRNREYIQRMMPNFGSARYTGQGLAHLAAGVVGGIGEARNARQERDYLARQDAEQDDISGRLSAGARGSANGFNILGQMPYDEASAVNIPPQAQPMSDSKEYPSSGRQYMQNPPRRGAPSPGVLPADDVQGRVTRNPSSLPGVTVNDSLQGASTVSGTMFPQGPNGQRPPTTQGATGGYRQPQGRPVPEEPFDPNLMMDALAPEGMGQGMSFERQPVVERGATPEGSKRDPMVNGGREFRQEEAPAPTVEELGEMGRNLGIDQETLMGLDLNSTESRNLGYLLRMMEAERTIRELDGANTWGNRALEMIPGQAIESFFMDPEYRRLMLARENFNEPALRAATGATINDSEMPRQRENYFPLPNDGPEIRAELQRQRQALMMSLLAGSGPAAAVVPPFGESVVPRTQQPQPATGQPQPTHRFNPATGQIEVIQ